MPERQSGRSKKATKKLLTFSPPPDAIFANNDMLAMGAMMAIKEKGLKIPEGYCRHGL